MTGLVKKGVLTATTALVSIAGNMPPTTITLLSGDPTRKIRLSSANFPAGETFYDPTVDGSAPGMSNCAALAPVTWVEFTGAIGDRYEVV